MSDAVLRIIADASVRATAVAAIVGGVLAVLRVQAPHVRHAAWTIVLVAMLGMPLLSPVLPAVVVPMPSFVSIAKMKLPSR